MLLCSPTNHFKTRPLLDEYEKSYRVNGGLKCCAKEAGTLCCFKNRKLEESNNMRKKSFQQKSDPLFNFTKIFNYKVTEQAKRFKAAQQ